MFQNYKFETSSNFKEFMFGRILKQNDNAVLMAGKMEFWKRKYWNMQLLWVFRQWPWKLNLDLSLLTTVQSTHEQKNTFKFQILFRFFYKYVVYFSTSGIVSLICFAVVFITKSNKWIYNSQVIWRRTIKIQKKHLKSLPKVWKIGRKDEKR